MNNSQSSNFPLLQPFRAVGKLLSVTAMSAYGSFEQVNIVFLLLTLKILLLCAHVYAREYHGPHVKAAVSLHLTWILGLNSGL